MVHTHPPASSFSLAPCMRHQNSVPGTQYSSFFLIYSSEESSCTFGMLTVQKNQLLKLFCQLQLFLALLLFG